MQRFQIITTYLLSGPVSPDSITVKIGLGIAGASFAIGIMGAIFSHRISGLRGNLIQKLLIAARWGGGLMLILLFLQHQDIEPFDMRLWPIIVVIPLLGYSLYTVITYRKRALQTVQQTVRHETYEKYLPQKKKK